MLMMYMVLFNVSIYKCQKQVRIIIYGTLQKQCDIAPLVIDHYLPEDRTCSHYSTLRSIIWSPSLSWLFNNTNGGIHDGAVACENLARSMHAYSPTASKWFWMVCVDTPWATFVLICAMNAMWPANAAHFKMCQS